MECVIVATAAGFRMTFKLVSWESPDESSGSDANWIEGSVDLASNGSGSFHARRSVTFRTDEFAVFGDELAALVSGGAKSAELSHIEDNFGLTVSVGDDGAELGAWVADPAGAVLRVPAASVKEDQLGSLLADVESAVRSYPVRGGAYD